MVNLTALPGTFAPVRKNNPASNFNFPLSAVTQDPGSQDNGFKKEDLTGFAEKGQSAIDVLHDAKKLGERIYDDIIHTEILWDKKPDNQKGKYYRTLLGNMGSMLSELNETIININRFHRELDDNKFGGNNAFAYLSQSIYRAAKAYNARKFDVTVNPQLGKDLDMMAASLEEASRRLRTLKYNVYETVLANEKYMSQSENLAGCRCLIQTILESENEKWIGKLEKYANANPATAKILEKYKKEHEKK